jgi:hypothetical protein
MGCETAQLIQSARDGTQCRGLVNSVMDLLVPEKEWNFLIDWATIRFSTPILIHGVSEP